MRRVQRSALVPYPAADMFALVNDIDAYPQFLPWCSAAQVLSRDAESLTARVEVARGGFHKAFTTRNILEPTQRIHMTLVEGPFRTLDGVWQFTALGEAGCKVSLDVQFEFSSRVLDLMAGPVFEHICKTLLDAFVTRAQDLHG